MARLFHIIGVDDWAGAVAAGVLSPLSLLTEGFVHFSFAEQVSATANRFYRDREDLIVVEFDPVRVGADVLVEDSEKDGTGFPHVYKAIPVAAAVATYPVSRAASGELTFDPGAPGSDFDSTAEGYLGDRAVSAEWDARYTERRQLWSGHPNGALVVEVAGLTPGRALDVGCGEGADAVWLAAAGWDVTALEVSGVALRRAAEHGRQAGVSVRWTHAELGQALHPLGTLQPGSFDLVSAQYPAVLRTPDSAAERALMAAVAPGGVLLFVHHAGMDRHDSHDSGFDPADYVWPSMVAALLDDDWAVEADEERPRASPPTGAGAGAHHVADIVLRARRLR